MNTERFKRKLTAIFSADVEGYSRLMGEDEDATIRTLTTYRELMSTLIQKHRGRVVDSPGDNLLAEFLSVVDAVRCAVETQEELRVRNAELPESRRMVFRIGINLGDVVEEEDRIYGDGINIAARVEGLAEGGGICISGTVYDSIKNKLSLSYESIGEHTVKNIKEPVRVYRMRIGPEAASPVVKEKKARLRQWQKAALGAVVALVVLAGAWAIWHFYFRPPPVEIVTEAEMAFPLPDKPSIAVLPFANVSGDPEQEYIADGITEQIIATLARNPHLFVIASNSTFTYKGKPVKVQQVSRELGVRYVVEGSVHKSGNKIRINAQLIDAITGKHMWARTYDRDLKDIFTLQDDIAMEILKAVGEKLMAMRYTPIGTKNVEAYLKLLKADMLLGRNEADTRLALRLIEESIVLDPEFAAAYGFLGHIYEVRVQNGWSKSPREDFKKAFELAQKSIDMGEALSGPHSTLGWLYFNSGKREKAIAEMERAIALDPNNIFAYVCLGNFLAWSERPEEAISVFKKAARLNPFPTEWQLFFTGNAYYVAGNYEEALSYYKRLQKKNPDNMWGWIGAASIYGQLGREKEARAAATEILRLDPKFALKFWEKWPGAKNRERFRQWIDGLRKAGLPENPPGTVPEKPSIAVLPFANISGDPKEDYLCDGITENIIMALSKTPKVLVIARNSSFTYKGKPVMVQQVSEELGVRYVLEGSMQRSGDRLRITAQLIDAKTGNHMWSDRYDRELKDLFAIQDEITMRIIEGLRVELTEGEQGSIYSRGTDNLEAFLKVLKGMDLVMRFRKGDNALARQMYEEAIALDPGYSNAYSCLAWTYGHDVVFGWTKTPEKSLERGLEFAQKAVSLDESNPNAFSALESIYRKMGMFDGAFFDKALAAGKRAVMLAPNGADANAMYSFTLLYLCRNEEALAAINKAIHLNPKTPIYYLLGQGSAYRNTGQYEKAIAAYKKSLLLNPNYRPSLYQLGETYRMVGQYEEAIAAFKKVIHLNPNYLLAHASLAASYSLTGQEEKAHAEAKEVLRVNPKFSIDRLIAMPHESFKCYEGGQKDVLINALRKAGLK